MASAWLSKSSWASRWTLRLRTWIIKATGNGLENSTGAPSWHCSWKNQGNFAFFHTSYWNNFCHKAEMGSADSHWGANNVCMREASWRAQMIFKCKRLLLYFASQNICSSPTSFDSAVYDQGPDCNLCVHRYLAFTLALPKFYSILSRFCWACDHINCMNNCTSVRLVTLLELPESHWADKSQFNSCCQT